jgi:chloride channel protein, CIC family
MYACDSNGGSTLRSITKPVHTFLKNDDTLRMAVEEMAKLDTDALPVISAKSKIIGILTYHNILSAYKQHIDENETANTHISLRRRRMKMLIKGRKFIRIKDVSK